MATFRLAVLGSVLIAGVVACSDQPGGAGATSSPVSLASPPMSVVPLESGNYTVPAADFHGIDESGQRIVFGGDPGDPQSTYVRDLPGPKPRRVTLPPVSSDGARLSGDGRRLYLQGGFADPAGGFGFGIGYVALDDQAASELQASTSSFLYSIDRTGRWLAYQAVPPGAVDGQFQYFLRDSVTGQIRQLTDEANVIDLGGTRCTLGPGSTPLVNAEGTQIVLVTQVALRPEPEMSDACRVYIYDIGTRGFRLAATLPPNLPVSRGALSADGRWLSLETQQPLGNGHWLGRASLIDLDSGQFTRSLTGDDKYPAFDSVISADGTVLIVSSQGDLDPRVGNTDYNMELFAYDVATGELSQITDTIGGLESGGGGTCPSYMPAVDAAADSVVVHFYHPFDEYCPSIRRAQRHAATGLYYRFGRVIRPRPGNQPPQWTPPSEARVVAGETLKVDIAASDPDGDPLTFFAQEVDKSDVPRGSVIEDHYDGTATFRWPTRLEQAGEYTLRLAVFDQVGGERVHDVHITVGAAEPVPCPGDCDGDAVVGVAELVAGVRIALQESAGESCAAADGDGDGRVSVDELIRATGAALNGC